MQTDSRFIDPRIMALKGARIIASLSAWPAARTATAENLQDDRWTYRFNLFDAARAPGSLDRRRWFRTARS